MCIRDRDRAQKITRKVIHKFNTTLMRHGIVPHLKRNYVMDASGRKLDIFQGCAQFGIISDAAAYIVNFHDTNKGFNRYFRTMYAVDEAYFHTIIYNSDFVRNTPDGRAVERAHLTDFENLKMCIRDRDGRDMEHYARGKKYRNVHFHGAYMPTDRYVFAQNTDIIHNVYNCGHTTGNAMGNKYYDGIIFGIPQICTEGSYMGELVKKNGVGLTVDLDSSNIADVIWNYYSSIRWDKFETVCSIELESVVEQQKIAKQKLIDFCSD